MDYGDYKSGMSSDFFWFKAKRGLIAVLLEKLGAGRPSRILNVGAGTGDDISVINRFGDVYVVDTQPEALDMVPDELAAEKKLCSITDMDYPDGFFDMVVAFDLLEHVEDDRGAVREIGRVLKPGGGFAFTVPAFNFLFSAHDRRLGHLRRYSKKSIKALLTDFQCVDMGYWMSSLFLPLAVYRLMGRGGESGAETYPHIPALLDSIFYRALSVENRLIKLGVPLPVGTTIYGVLRSGKTQP